MYTINIKQLKESALDSIKLLEGFIKQYPTIKDEFRLLATVPGMNKGIAKNPSYHDEGNALIHTMMVYLVYLHIHPTTDENELRIMAKVCLLHDVGKITTWCINPLGQVGYPNHAKEGADKLATYLDESDEDFDTIKWYLENHIKPLFWKSKGINTTPAVNKNCRLDWLVYLALSDIQGSETEVDQSELIEYLYNLNV